MSASPLDAIKEVLKPYNLSIVADFDDESPDEVKGCYIVNCNHTYTEVGRLLNTQNNHFELQVYHFRPRKYRTLARKILHLLSWKQWVVTACNSCIYIEPFHFSKGVEG